MIITALTLGGSSNPSPNALGIDSVVIIQLPKSFEKCRFFFTNKFSVGASVRSS